MEKKRKKGKLEKKRNVILEKKIKNKRKKIKKVKVGKNEKMQKK
jgi:hypothetical protein